MPDLDPESETTPPPTEPPGHATGPRTREGKKRSSQNSLQHGCCSKTLLLPDEDPNELRQLLESWLYDYRADTYTVDQLVRETVSAQWIVLRNRSRYNQCEHSLHQEQPNCLNWTDDQHHRLERFRRYLRQAERQFNSAFHNLERLHGRRFREGMQLQRAQERAAAIETKRAQALLQQNQPKPEKPEKKAAKAEPPTPTKPSEILFQGQNHPKKRRKIPLLEQWVEVTIQENGETLTRLFPSNKNLIERGKAMLPPPELVYRRLNFPHGVPPEYEWVNAKEEKRKLGGCGIQRMTTDTWLEVIAREAPEFERPGYKSSFAPEHIGPTGVGNLPRPKERGGCDCHVCTKNQAILDRQAMAPDAALGSNEKS